MSVCHQPSTWVSKWPRRGHQPIERCPTHATLSANLRTRTQCQDFLLAQGLGVDVAAVGDAVRTRVVRSIRQVRTGTRTPILPTVAFDSASPSISFGHVVRNTLNRISRFRRITRRRRATVSVNGDSSLTNTVVTDRRTSLSFSTLIRIHGGVTAKFGSLVDVSVWPCRYAGGRIGPNISNISATSHEWRALNTSNKYKTYHNNSNSCH